MSTSLSRSTAFALVPGPVWSSFEQFRKGGSTALEEIPEHGAATLVGKGTTYRILRDSDFQYLIGLAADIHRLQQGLNLVTRFAKVVAKHPDHEHVQLFLHSAEMVAGSPLLPTREGHDAFQLTPEELEAETLDDFDLDNAAIPRPGL